MTKLIELTEIVLFDWGNTLMVDFPIRTRENVRLEVVEEVAGRVKCWLRFLKHHKPRSQPMPLTRQNKTLFERLNELVQSQYLSGYRKGESWRVQIRL